MADLDLPYESRDVRFERACRAKLETDARKAADEAYRTAPVCPVAPPVPRRVADNVLRRLAAMAADDRQRWTAAGVP